MDKKQDEIVLFCVSMKTYAKVTFLILDLAGLFVFGALLGSSVCQNEPMVINFSFLAIEILLIIGIAFVCRSIKVYVDKIIYMNFFIKKEYRFADLKKPKSWVDDVKPYGKVEYYDFYNAKGKRIFELNGENMNNARRLYIMALARCRG